MWPDGPGKGAKAGSGTIGGAFFIALTAAFLAGLGGRDQLQAGALRDAAGPGGALFAIALGCTAGTAVLAAWAGGIAGSTLSDSAETMLAALAFGLVAFELAWWRAPRKPREPTRSLGALALVLLARQIGDAPRLAIFALAAATGAPVWVAAGGAIGAAGGMAACLMAGREQFMRLPLRALRLALAALAGLTATLLALSARGMI